MFYRTLARCLQEKGWKITDEGHGNIYPHYFKYDHPDDDSRGSCSTIEVVCASNHDGTPGRVLRLYQGGKILYPEGKRDLIIDIGQIKRRASTIPAADLTVTELLKELQSRSEVIAVQVWTTDALKNAFETQHEISKPTALQLQSARKYAEAELENCTDTGWNVLYDAVDHAVAEHPTELQHS